MKNKYVFTVVLLLMLTAVGAGIIHISSAQQINMQDREDTVHIVTSFYPMYIAVKNVAGGIPGVELSNLTEPQTGCLHDYQLTPQDLVLLSEADVFVINGGGIESFLDDVAADYPNLTIITASDGIDYLESGRNHGHEEEHSDTDGHDHGSINAHVWMDVHRYMEEVEIIAECLVQKDPVHAESYRRNADEYLEKLKGLRAEIQEQEGIAAGRRVVIFHDAFAYLADVLGLEIAEVIAMDGETSFSANQISRIVSLIRKEQIDMLFTEEQYGTKLADAVSQETDAEVYVLDSLVSGEDDADSYINGMKKNLELLKEAFGKVE